jgi:hypothetical protein
MRTPESQSEYVNSIEEAIHSATFADNENDMATVPFTVERETHYLKVIRKAGGFEHPTIMLFKVVPKNGYSCDLDRIADEIADAIGLYGDVSISFDTSRPIPSAVVPFSIV